MERAGKSSRKYSLMSVPYLKWRNERQCSLSKITQSWDQKQSSLFNLHFHLLILLQNIILLVFVIYEKALYSLAGCTAAQLTDASFMASLRHLCRHMKTFLVRGRASVLWNLNTASRERVQTPWLSPSSSHFLECGDTDGLSSSILDEDDGSDNVGFGRVGDPLWMESLVIDHGEPIADLGCYFLILFLGKIKKKQQQTNQKTEVSYYSVSVTWGF